MFAPEIKTNDVSRCEMVYSLLQRRPILTRIVENVKELFTMHSELAFPLVLFRNNDEYIYFEFEALIISSGYSVGLDFNDSEDIVLVLEMAYRMNTKCIA